MCNSKEVIFLNPKKPCCTPKTTKTVDFIELITICIAQHHSAALTQHLNTFELVYARWYFQELTHQYDLGEL
jgi:hypothetical protein